MKIFPLEPGSNETSIKFEKTHNLLIKCEKTSHQTYSKSRNLGTNKANQLIYNSKDGLFLVI